jgi:putative ABC transport system permease protein
MLGENVAPVLFPDGQAVGKDVMIDGSDFLVIGVVEKPKGGIGMGDEDRRVLIPFSTFRKIYPMADELNIRMQAYPKVLDQAVDQAREVLERRRKVPYGGKDNFSIETAEQQVQEFHNIVGMVALAMVVLSSIGLLVGGIGVMNIMLVSVTERTREIGVRKAIGARRSDVIWQFLTEALVLTGMGGIIGVLLGGGISLLIHLVVPSLPSSIPLWSILLAVGVSMSVGLFFGMYPAIKAARLDPVEALRYE